MSGVSLQPGAAPTGQPLGPPDLAAITNIGLPNLDTSQIMALLRNLPNVFSKQLTENGTLKEDAAQTLSNLAQYQAANGGNPQLPQPYPGLGDPGPSSHPRGPPDLGHLAGVAVQALPARVGAPQEEGANVNEDGDATQAAASAPPKEGAGAPTSAGGRSRGRGGAAMGSDEWTRQRKDNHKEVERRRRGNINEGINELGRIVPNGSGEKAKGAILSRAVQYIHHLKENEARNIEKWTLEKLLMDQAMGDLQAQLEEVRKMWEEERLSRQRVEAELAALRGGGASSVAGEKRPNEGEDGETGQKRQRTE